jgi:hypothetical protein
MHCNCTICLAAQVPGYTIEEKWRLVKNEPNLWWDNRVNKINPKGPDFKLKDKNRQVDVALWLSSKSTPEWAKEEFT